MHQCRDTNDLLLKLNMISLSKARRFLNCQDNAKYVSFLMDSEETEVNSLPCVLCSQQALFYNLFCLRWNTNDTVTLQMLLRGHKT